jgi:hypothetical protein
MRNFIFLAFVTCRFVSATPMLEPSPRSLDLKYENGDRLTVNCARGTADCVLVLHVQGEGFRFEAKELGVAHLYPESAHLYSGAFSGGARHFSFSIGAECPEQHDGIAYSCAVNALVQSGKLSDVRVIRTREEDVPAPRR